MSTAGVITASLLTGMLTGTITNKSLALSTVAPSTAPAGAIILHGGDNVSAIVNAAPVGATFFFEPGIYRGVSITPKTGQTFIGAEGAILNGSAVLTNFTQQGNFWTIGGQTQQGVRHATDAGDGVSMRPGYPETVFINDTPLKPVDALPKVVPGAFYFDYAADKIYIAENPRGQKVEAGKLTYAFQRECSERNGAESGDREI